MKPVRCYEITVRGFPPMLYSARSPAKARTRCWHDYLSYDGSVSFGDFLRLSTVRSAEPPPGAHERILVCGKPATRIIERPGGGNLFMYDGSDTVMRAHDMEIAPHPTGEPK